MLFDSDLLPFTEELAMRLAALFGVATLAMVSVGEAAPVRIDYQSIVPLTVEAFEDAPPGSLTNPTFFNGFAFSIQNGGPGPELPEPPNVPVISDSPAICGWTTRCLWGVQIGGRREFASFNPSTTAFGLRLSVIQESDLIEAVTTGGSGVSALIFSGPQELGLFDPAGLLSVRFANLGTDYGEGGFGRGNYSFDDVITGVPIPVPPTLILLLGAILASRILLRGRALPT
jgi:hypothetical protein